MIVRTGQTVLLVMICILFSGCGQNHGKDSKSALLKTTDPAPVHIKNGTSNHVEQIKHDISSFSEVYDVAVIKGKKDTLVAYKVKHMQRFRMKDIEKKMNKMLEEKYPDENFTVSSDYKIFLEAIRLKDAMKKSKFSSKKLEKRLKKIIILSKEMT